ncbi:putative holin [Stenotrophomonas phage SOVA965]
MNAIILALGGIRASCFAALASVLLLAAGVQTWRLGNAQDAYAAYRDKVVAATAKASQAAATAREKAQEAREAYLWKSGEAENAYQAGRDSAIQAQQTVVADLNADRIRLRGEWSACMSKRVSAGSAIASPAIGSDGPADVPAEAFGRVFRVGSDADNQVQWLQSELIATRELYGKCMVPKEK